MRSPAPDKAPASTANNSFQRLDWYARKGHDYAVAGGGKLPANLKLNRDMDLLAFNAGISNANVRHGLNIPRVSPCGRPAPLTVDTGPGL